VTAPTTPPGFSARRRRLWALVRKETRQVVRDPSSIAIGVVLPLILILLFGYAMSLDVKHVPVALVVDQPSPQADEIVAAFRLSPYFQARQATSMAEARELMLSRTVDGVVYLPADFARRVAAGDADVQLLVHGVDANRARIIETYAEGAIAQAEARQAAEGVAAEGAAAPSAGVGQAVVQSQLWFNNANDSRYYLVPGLIVLIITLIGAFMTAMVVAREWERGTFEALFVTPVRTEEILVGKVAPYFALGLGGLFLCLFAARFLFEVPFRGSLSVLLGGSMLYLLVSIGVGLLVSSGVKSQFLASQLVLAVTFMPALMLSGFIYDLRNVPLVVRLISYIVPARYYVSLLQTTFLAGDVWRVILPNTAVLAVVAAALLVLARRATRKSLG
jgi:ABC-2 type transport system permease protein